MNKYMVAAASEILIYEVNMVLAKHFALKKKNRVMKTILLRLALIGLIPITLYSQVDTSNIELFETLNEVDVQRDQRVLAVDLPAGLLDVYLKSDEDDWDGDEVED